MQIPKIAILKNILHFLLTKPKICTNHLTLRYRYQAIRKKQQTEMGTRLAKKKGNLGTRFPPSRKDFGISRKDWHLAG